MKIGIVYISSINSEFRRSIVLRTLPSLIKTNVEGLEKPVILVTYRQSDFVYDEYFEQLKLKFEVDITTDPAGYSGAVSVLQEAASRLLDTHSDVTHVSFMCDDSLCNPEWLQELSKLIQRHPDGIAWAVYRSALTAYHQIIGGDDVDVLMNMHDGIGCLTREEYRDFVKNGHAGAPDMQHASRQGNRWATKRDYIENLGVHPEYGRLDQAIDFVGE